MSFMIIGSCVTRDIWEISDQPYAGKYFARTSFSTLMSPPVKLKQAHLERLSNPFRRACVIADAYRQTLEWITQKQPDEIILDFIGERFNIIETGCGRLTNSFELHQSKAVETLFPNARVIENLSDEGIAIWTEGLKIFMEHVRNASRKSKVILHRAWFQTHIKQNGTSIPWEPKVNIPGQTITIAQCNNLLSHYYECAEAEGITDSFEAAPEFQLSADSHKWGRSPLHYIDEYYIDCYRKLENMLT